MQNHQIPEMSTTDAQSINQKLDQVLAQNESLAETQDKMLYIISGNPLDNKDRGMLGRLDKVERGMERVYKYWYLVVGGSFVIGYIFQNLLQYLVKK